MELRDTSLITGLVGRTDSRARFTGSLTNVLDSMDHEKSHNVIVQVIEAAR